MDAVSDWEPIAADAPASDWEPVPFNPSDQPLIPHTVQPRPGVMVNPAAKGLTGPQLGSKLLQGVQQAPGAAASLLQPVSDVARAIPADIATSISAGKMVAPNLRAAMSEGDEPLPIDEVLKLASSDSPTAAVLGKVSQGIAASAPIMAVGLPEGVLGKLVAAGFSAQMIKGANDAAKALGTEMGKNPDDRDKDVITSSISDLIQSGVFAPAAAAHAGKPSGKYAATEALALSLLKQPKSEHVYRQIADQIKGSDFTDEQATQAAVEALDPRNAQRTAATPPAMRPLANLGYRFQASQPQQKEEDYARHQRTATEMGLRSEGEEMGGSPPLRQSGKTPEAPPQEKGEPEKEEAHGPQEPVLLKPAETGKSLGQHIGATFDTAWEPMPGGPSLLQFTWRAPDVPKDSPIYGATFYIPAEATPAEAMAKAKSKALEFGVKDYEPKKTSEQPPAASKPQGAMQAPITKPAAPAPEAAGTSIQFPNGIKAVIDFKAEDARYENAKGETVGRLKTRNLADGSIVVENHTLEEEARGAGAGGQVIQKLSEQTGKRIISDEHPSATAKAMWERLGASRQNVTMDDGSTQKRYVLNPRERIVAAALRDDKTGKISTGLTHGLAADETVNPGGNAQNIGFMTSTGRYVTQDEAAKMTGGSSGSEQMAYYLQDSENLKEEVQNLVDGGMTKQAAENELSTELKRREAAESGAAAPKLRPGEKGTGDLLQGEQPFNLAGEQAVDPERMDREKAAADAAKKANDEFQAQHQQELGMAGPGSPSVAQGPDTGGGFQDQSGRDIYGVAQRVREARAKAGQVAMVEPGAGVTAQETIDWGQTLIQEGVDPEKALSDFEKTGKVSYALIAVARARGEQLAQDASQVEQKFGTDSSAFKTAKKALSDWDLRSKSIQTEWHKMGMAQQGETDLDTGDFTEMAREYTKTTGRELNPSQQRDLHKVTDRSKKANSEVEAAKPVLAKAVEEIKPPEPAIPPKLRPLVQKVIEKIETAADAARQRIAARKAARAQGGSLFAGVPLDPQDFDDYLIVGAEHLAHAIEDPVKWGKAMVDELGEILPEDLKRLYVAAKAYADKIVSGESTPDVAPAVKAAVKKVGATRSKTQAQYEREAIAAAHKTVRQAAASRAEAEVKARIQEAKIKTKAWWNSLEGQRAVFKDYKSGNTLDPEQLKTIWKRVLDYISKADDDKATIIHKVAEDLRISPKDALRGLGQSKAVKRIADDLWQKQQHARLMKRAAQLWIDHANDTFLQKAIPTIARTAFTLKTGLHGTVAMGTHAPLVAATNPVIFTRNFGRMYNLVLHPEYFEMAKAAQARRKNYTVAQRNGLVNDMTKLEDWNDPQLTQGFPRLAQYMKQKLPKTASLLGSGVRGYSVLKILRQDLFDQAWDKLSQADQSDEMAKAIADSVNHITGVTKSAGGKGLDQYAHYALFAPKLEASRVAVTVVDPARAINSLMRGRNMTAAEKWFAKDQLASKLKILGVASSLLAANQALNSLLGDKKKLNGIPEWAGGGGWNPMASDFMKFRLAGMNFAWGSPFLTMMRMPLRVWQITSAGGSGKMRFLIYPDESAYKEIGSYARTQASPFISPLMTLLFKGDYQMRPLPKIPGHGAVLPVPKRLRAQGIMPYTWKEFGFGVVLPIPFEEGLKEAMHYDWGNLSDEQAKAIGKAVVTTAIMAGTGGRVAEDWQKPVAAPLDPAALRGTP